MREFEARLAGAGIPVTVRDTRGTQIDGACGQLAASSRPVTPTAPAVPGGLAAPAGPAVPGGTAVAVTAGRVG
jgi:hypothetical protein